MTLKNENRHAYQAADRLAQEGLPPFTHTEKPDTTHGRFDRRSIEDYPFEALEANLPGCRSLAVIRRTRTTDSEKVQQVACTTDHPPEKECARSFARLATAIGPAARYASTGCATTACTKTSSRQKPQHQLRSGGTTRLPNRDQSKPLSRAIMAFHSGAIPQRPNDCVPSCRQATVYIGLARKKFEYGVFPGL